MSIYSGNVRVIRSERMVYEALTALQERPRFGLRYSITKVVHAEPNSPMDKTKRDFDVTLNDKVVIPIQVKSHPRKIHAHRKACRKLGIIIPDILVDTTEKIRDIMKKLVSILNEHFDTFRTAANGFVKRITDEARHQCKHRQHYCYRPQRFAMVH